MHLVVRTRPEVVSGWSDEEVARRWLRLCPGRKDPLAVAREEDVRFEVLLKDVEKLKVCRERLGNLSWFMRGLSGVIARRANEEDGCKGSLLRLNPPRGHPASSALRARLRRTPDQLRTFPFGGTSASLSWELSTAERYGSLYHSVAGPAFVLLRLLERRASAWHAGVYRAA